MKRILIIGGSGLLGRSLMVAGRDRFEVFATYNLREINSVGCATFNLDKRDKQKTFSLIERINPDIVIDTAAILAGKCELNKEEAWEVNVKGTENIALACNKINSKLILISTDYVFDGRKGVCYAEDDPPNPIDWYGKTKLAAEKVVQRICDDYLICRTSVIYGFHPLEWRGLSSSSGKKYNFALWLINELEKGKTVQVVTDEFNSPTFSDNLAEVILELAEKNKKGIYHTAGKGCISRFDFAKMLADIFKLDKALLKPVTCEMLGRPPRFTCLETRKIEKELGKPLLSVKEGLKIMRRQYNNFWRNPR